MLAEATGSALAVACSFVAYLFSTIVQEPYMDEIFHVPQAQQYCAHNFSHWDPMITTPPGLYISSFIWIKAVSFLVTSDLCTLTFLRGQNAVFTVLLFFVIHSLLKDTHSPNHSSLYCVVSALNLTLFPVLYFFSFLYYTDVGATLLVLTGHLLAGRDRHFAAASVLLTSLAFRQTSIVWLVFVASSVAVNTLESAPAIAKIKNPYCDSRYPRAVLRHLFASVPAMLRLLWPYLAVMVLFLVFVLVNGSVALGDKTHHEVCFHAPQLFYFFGFAAALSPSVFVVRGQRSLRSLARNWKLTLCTLVVMGVVMGVAVHYFTYSHSYLLADNRHYPFYVWKNVFQRHFAVKYLLVPVYAVLAVYLFAVLAQGNSPLWVTSFLACCLLSLVPQKLLEFRYFILPFLLFRIHTHHEPHHSSSPGSANQSHTPSLLPPLLVLVAELAFYVALNAATIWVFLYRPFKWPNTDQWQRFIW